MGYRFEGGDGPVAAVHAASDAAGAAGAAVPPASGSAALSQRLMWLLRLSVAGEGTDSAAHWAATVPLPH